ncbi:sigma-54-dependent Fis family transcriptional regulator [Thiomicrorhabdus xiamenensis]|uniref:Sigma 54-interacting transcriptional regulator n=1 Tax=Thiomicrorhabdus xiamenensis TaxID=2739063 RepID=A0A7D4THB1_9GAMM|nr:sigma 54-interacting transcriptional regulator [Thiomicrorhabdus xiamenensis]QKI90168.1 sigma 54-interacting transcriptional regulator [Thiomicrorhabdus xiamenensis]
MALEALDIAEHSEYVVIKEAAEQIERANEPEQAIVRILSLISRQMGLNRGRVLLREKSEPILYTAYAFGLTEVEIARSRFADNEGITGKVMRMGMPIIIPNIDLEEDYLCRTVDRSTLPQEPVAFIAVPILRKGRTIGVLAVNRLKNRSRALDKDLSILKLIAIFISEILSVNAMLEKQTQVLKEENEQLRAVALSQGSQYGIIGESPAVMGALSKAARAANVSVTVLLKGESGTGKEKFSRMLHMASNRQDGPFIAINCAAIPLELLESELFGHEKGAFTGATQTKPGKIEMAHHGTLFLDEIGDLDFGLQAKLLRVLEDRTITRVGSNKPIPVDVRIIVASHKNLQTSVNEGNFRLDLFYRLNVFPIELPPLRERDGDIRLLARHFLNQANQEYHTNVIFDRGAIAFLETYEWPGNIRQLENIIKRAVLLAEDGQMITDRLIRRIIREESGIVFNGEATEQPEEVKAISVNDEISTRMEPQPQYEATFAPQVMSRNGSDEIKRNYWKVSESEKDILLQALERAHGNKSHAARMLNMTPRQYNYRFKKLGLG